MTCVTGFSDIFDNELLSASQLICGMTVLCVINNELTAASQAYDISVGDYTGSGRQPGLPWI